MSELIPKKAPAQPATPVPAGAAAEFDLVQPFLLESSGIRGNLVRLGSAAEHIVTRHAYPDPLARLLAELLTLTAMLSSMMKFDGVFSLQTSSDGPVGLMVADMTSAGHLRGYAGFDADRLAAAVGNAERAETSPGVAELLGKGHLAYTVD